MSSPAPQKLPNHPPFVRLTFTPASMPQPTLLWPAEQTARPVSPQVDVPLNSSSCTLTLWITPETWASPHPCLRCSAPTMSGQRWPPNVVGPGVLPAKSPVPELFVPPLKPPVSLVPPPDVPFVPWLCAAIVAVKPPPNEAV